MLLYDYYCSKCEKVWEIYVYNNTDEVRCKECDSIMNRLLSAPPFHLKGKGWYRDGYGLYDKKEGEKFNGTSKRS